MWDFYEQLWMPFGELLTDMERSGIKVDLQHMKAITEQAKVQIGQFRPPLPIPCSSGCCSPLSFGTARFGNHRSIS